MSRSPAQLCKEDFVWWTEPQSAVLREAAVPGLGANLPLDWENPAEEIDSLGRSPRCELRSRIGIIIDHLIKLESSPAGDPRRGRIDTVGGERAEIEILLDDAPGLRGEVAPIVAAATPRAIRTIRRP